ncbi:proto-oncogene Mas-like [Pelodytes ibericus]
MTHSSPVTESINWINSTKLDIPIYSIIISPIIVSISVIGVIGNSLVIWFLSLKIKKNPCTIYIFNLALADAFFLLFVTVFHIFSIVVTLTLSIEQLAEDVHFVNAICTLTISCLFGYNTSLCLLTAISVERCISVLYPIWYHCNRPKHLSSIICTIIWLLSCLFSVLEFSYCYDPSYNLTYAHRIIDKECKYIFLVICCLSFMVFIPFMILSSIVLLIKVWTSSQQRQPRKLYLVIAITVIFFLVLAMPMRILLLVWYKHRIMPPFPIMDIIAMFTSVNSSINPFIYFLIGHQGSGSGKLTLLTILQAVFRDDGSQIRRQQQSILPTRETIM